MKTARQRVSATKSGNGLQKTLQTISIWRWLLFILFFYFSVVLVVIRKKSPEIRGFPRQPARQRDSNRGCNGRSFSEWKLHLFCDLHKTIHRFFRRVAGVRCRVFTLPALLSAIFGKHSWVREIPPAGNALVHYLVDFPDFPLLRLVKWAQKKQQTFFRFTACMCRCNGRRLFSCIGRGYSAKAKLK